MMKIQAGQEDINKLFDGIPELKGKLKITSITASDGVEWTFDFGKSLLPAIRGYLQVQKVTDCSITLEINQLGAVNQYVPDLGVKAVVKSLLSIPWLKRHIADGTDGMIKIESASQWTIGQYPLQQLLQRKGLSLCFVVKELRHSETVIHAGIELN